MEEWTTVVLGGEMTVTVPPQAHGVTETVTVMNVTVHHQLLGVDVMIEGVMIVGVKTDGVTIVGVKIVVVTTDGVTIVAVMTVDATIVDAMTVDVTIVTGRWLGEDVTETSATVHQGMRGVVTVIAGIGIVMIVSVVTVKETVLEEIVMIVIALAGGVSDQMTVIRGGVKGTSQAVTSGDENHHLHVLKVGLTPILNLGEKLFFVF